MIIHKCNLLDKAKELASDLKECKKDVLKRVLHYYLRHHHYDELLQFLSCSLPPRGGTEEKAWKLVCKTLQKEAWRKDLAHRPWEEVAFILGWASRILPSISAIDLMEKKDGKWCCNG